MSCSVYPATTTRVGSSGTTVSPNACFTETGKTPELAVVGESGPSDVPSEFEQALSSPAVVSAIAHTAKVLRSGRVRIEWAFRQVGYRKEG